MSMTQGELLRFIGNTLYGANAPWGNRMANDLDVNRRTIQRWLDGTEITPRGIWDELYGKLSSRETQAAAALGMINKFLTAREAANG